MHIWEFLFQNIVCKIRDVIYRISLFSTWRLCASDAKTKIRQRDWLKLAGEKIRREQVGTVPIFCLFARTNSPSGK